MKLSFSLPLFGEAGGRPSFAKATDGQGGKNMPADLSAEVSTKAEPVNEIGLDIFKYIPLCAEKMRLAAEAAACGGPALLHHELRISFQFSFNRRWYFYPYSFRNLFGAVINRNSSFLEGFGIHSFFYFDGFRHHLAGAYYWR